MTHSQEEWNSIIKLGGLDSSPLQGSLGKTQLSHNLSGHTLSRDPGSYRVLFDTASPVVTLDAAVRSLCPGVPFSRDPGSTWTSEPALCPCCFPSENLPWCYIEGESSQGRGEARDQLLSLTSDTQFRACSEPALLGLQVLFVREHCPASLSGELKAPALSIAHNTAIDCVPSSGC